MAEDFLPVSAAGQLRTQMETLACFIGGWLVKAVVELPLALLAKEVEPVITQALGDVIVTVRSQELFNVVSRQPAKAAFQVGIVKMGGERIMLKRRP